MIDAPSRGHHSSSPYKSGRQDIKAANQVSASAARFHQSRLDWVRVHRKPPIPKNLRCSGNPHHCGSVALRAWYNPQVYHADMFSIYASIRHVFCLGTLEFGAPYTVSLPTSSWSYFCPWVDSTPCEVRDQSNIEQLSRGCYSCDKKMSGVEVAALVGTTISAFWSRTQLFRHWRDQCKRRSRAKENQRLDSSLLIGGSDVQRQYNMLYKRLGDILAIGDGTSPISFPCSMGRQEHKLEEDSRSGLRQSYSHQDSLQCILLYVPMIRSAIIHGPATCHQELSTNLITLQQNVIAHLSRTLDFGHSAHVLIPGHDALLWSSDTVRSGIVAALAHQYQRILQARLLSGVSNMQHRFSCTKCGPPFPGECFANARVATFPYHPHNCGLWRRERQTCPTCGRLYQVRHWGY